MGNDSSYTLILGVQLDLERKVVETNPDWKGIEDKTTSQYILSTISEKELERIRPDGKLVFYHPEDGRLVKKQGYAYGEKEIIRSAVFPDGTITAGLNGNEFAQQHQDNPDKLCFINDERWLGGKQLLGVVLLHHSTMNGYAPADEQKILAALSQKDKITAIINQYGFDFQPEEVTLHQYLCSM